VALLDEPAVPPARLAEPVSLEKPVVLPAHSMTVLQFKSGT